MRNLNEDGIIFTRNGIDEISTSQITEAGGNLDDANNYATNDILHSGLLTFPDAFTSSNNSWVEVHYCKVWIYDTANFKPELKLMLFSNPGTLATTNPPVMNVAFDVKTDFTRSDMKGNYTLAAATFKSIKIGAETDDAEGVWNLQTLGVKYIKNTTNDLNLYGLLIYNGAGSEKFAANATLDVSIGLIHH
jgi:hypothetical protein